MDIERIYYKHWRYLGIYILSSDSKPHSKPHCVAGSRLRPYTRGKTEWSPTSKGGKTECHLVLSNGTEIVGTADCSRKDNFSYCLGRQIAYGRAMKKYNALRLSQHTEKFYAMMA